jgi:hypothetical protein
MLTSLSKSFKANIAADGDGPKPGTDNAFHSGASASINLDVDIPVGYVAYAAKIQISVRIGPTISAWGATEQGDQKAWFPNEAAPRLPNTYVSAGRFIPAGKVTVAEVKVLPTDPDPSGTEKTDLEKSLKADTVGTVFFTDPLLSDHIAVSVSRDICLALSGTIHVFCVRKPSAYAQWQQETYDAIMTAYTKMKMDYDRAAL